MVGVQDRGGPRGLVELGGRGAFLDKAREAVTVHGLAQELDLGDQDHADRLALAPWRRVRGYWIERWVCLVIHYIF